MFKDYAVRLAKESIALQEDIICEAISRDLGSDKWEIEDVKDRCKFTIDTSHTETFFFDGKPIVELFPATTSFVGGELKAEQNYRWL